jgi:hypothetical protein
MVRSNPAHEIGFLSNERRMNVAVTRAKRLCILIGDSGTCAKNKFLKGLIDYFRSADGSIVRSAFDYQGNTEVRMMYGASASTPTITKQEIVEKQNKKVKE